MSHSSDEICNVTNRKKKSGFHFFDPRCAAKMARVKRIERYSKNPILIVLEAKYTNMLFIFTKSTLIARVGRKIAAERVKRIAPQEPHRNKQLNQQFTVKTRFSFTI